MKNVIATGAENKTSFSVIANDQVYVSAPVGDLTHVDNFVRFEREIKEYTEQNKVIPDCVACDLHPDYRSTYLAKVMAEENPSLSLVKVQHHFAHIVACMFDNDIDEEVIGVAFDGTGFGDDHKSWGSEFMVCTRKDFMRKFHLKYVSQPGADMAAREPWRMALAYLYQAYGKGFADINIPLFERIPTAKTLVIAQMIDQDINCPLTSSMGRLFDAVSSLVGICDIAKFEAEGAILLEEKAGQNIAEFYEYETVGIEIDVSRMIRQIVEDISKGVDIGIISAKFHNTIGEIVFDVANRIYEDGGLEKVLISGGCFQNKYLVKYLEKKFKGSELKLYKHNKYSTTDLGVAVGQAVVAAYSE